MSISQKPFFTFADIFAGIGGMRIGFEQEGGECIFTCDWDKYAQKTYYANFFVNEKIYGDIKKLNANEIPDHDVLLAGFPCQPFSLAGISKKNSLGKPHGFLDDVQGTLFFEIVRIISAKKPKVFVLENVKNLKSHDAGKTFALILHILENYLHYYVQYRIIDGQHWVPQHRERIIIIGFREYSDFSFDSLVLPKKGLVTMNSVLHKLNGAEPYIEHDDNKYFDYKKNMVHPKYTLSDKLWNYLKSYASKHRNMGHGFGFSLVDDSSIARTLSARYYKDGAEILVYQGRNKNPRRLTPRECARLMGFDDSFKIPVSDTQAYKQFGNSVVVPMFKFIAHELKPFLV